MLEAASTLSLLDALSQLLSVRSDTVNICGQVEQAQDKLNECQHDIDQLQDKITTVRAFLAVVMSMENNK